MADDERVKIIQFVDQLCCCSDEHFGLSLVARYRMFILFGPLCACFILEVYSHCAIVFNSLRFKKYTRNLLVTSVFVETEPVLWLRRKTVYANRLSPRCIFKD